jgi:eukaryotic-like serine/threonine-protein kinase
MSGQKDDEITEPLRFSFTTTITTLPTKSKLSPGLMLNDHYLLEKEVGDDAFSNIYIAHDSKLGLKVIIKVLREEVLKDETAIEIVRQGIEALAKLHAPGIDNILDKGILNDGTPYLVLHYTEGVNLRSILKPE